MWTRELTTHTLTCVPKQDACVWTKYEIAVEKDRGVLVPGKSFTSLKRHDGEIVVVPTKDVLYCYPNLSLDIKALLNEAAKLLGTDPANVLWWSWPVDFPNSNGPKPRTGNSIAMQAFTTW